MTQKKCDHCKVFKEEDEFNWKFKSLGVRHNTGRECMALHQKNTFKVTHMIGTWQMSKKEKM